MDWLLFYVETLLSCPSFICLLIEVYFSGYEYSSSILDSGFLVEVDSLQERIFTLEQAFEDYQLTEFFFLILGSAQCYHLKLSSTMESFID